MKRRPHLSHRPIKGFTLVEMVIVIIVLGILAVIAVPKLINLKGDANRAVISGAVGSIKTAVQLFKMKSITSGEAMETQVEFEGVKGSHYQPWAAGATDTGFTAGYSSVPEIFEGAGLDIEDWSYRIHVESGSYAVAASPKSALDKAEPTIDEIRSTGCYLNYHWRNTGEPVITTELSGCD